MTARSPSRFSLLAQYRWIPWLFVACFLIVFAVNGGLVYFAARTWPGLASENAYNEGIAYNQVLDREAKEARLGWSLVTEYRPSGTRSYEISVTVHDAGGHVVEDIAVEGKMVRPLGRPVTVPLNFVSEGSGTYLASVALPSAGQWDVYLSARRANDTVHGGRRLVVPDK